MRVLRVPSKELTEEKTAMSRHGSERVNRVNRFERIMTRAFVFICVVVVGHTFVTTSSAQGPMQFIGEWRVNKAVIEGEDETERFEWVLTVAEDSLRFIRDDLKMPKYAFFNMKTEGGVFHFDAVMENEIIPNEYFWAGMMKLEDDTLTLTFAHQRGECPDGPTQFESTDENGYHQFELRRIE